MKLICCRFRTLFSAVCYLWPTCSAEGVTDRRRGECGDVRKRRTRPPRRAFPDLKQSLRSHPRYLNVRAGSCNEPTSPVASCSQFQNPWHPLARGRLDHCLLAPFVMFSIVMLNINQLKMKIRQKQTENLLKFPENKAHPVISVIGCRPEWAQKCD